MKIQYLGTAAAEGWPAIFCRCDYCQKARSEGGKNIRTRSQILIDDLYLVDFPADTYAHALREGIDFGLIEHLFITHSHEDHFYPDDLLMRMAPYAYPDFPLQLWSNQTVCQKIDRMKEKYSALAIETTPLKAGDTVKAGKYTVTALAAAHMPTENALLYIFDDGEHKLFQAHDTGWFSEETWELLAGQKLDLVNFDCTFGPKDNRYGHLGIPNILEIREKMLQIDALKTDGKSVITHFSHNGGFLHEELEAHVKGMDLIVAYDGMTIEL